MLMLIRPPFFSTGPDAVARVILHLTDENTLRGMLAAAWQTIACCGFLSRNLYDGTKA